MRWLGIVEEVNVIINGRIIRGLTSEYLLHCPFGTTRRPALFMSAETTDSSSRQCQGRDSRGGSRGPWRKLTAAKADADGAHNPQATMAMLVPVRQTRLKAQQQRRRRGNTSGAAEPTIRWSAVTTSVEPTENTAARWCS